MTNAESAIVGCAIRWPDQSLPFLTESGIRPDVFGTKTHTTLFRAALALWLEKKHVSAETVALSLGDDLQGAGGAVALFEMVSAAPPSSSLPQYVESVKAQNAKRRLAACLTRQLAEIESAENVAEIMSEIETEICNITSARNSNHIPATKEIVQNVVRNLYERTNGKIAGLSTGIEKLDEETGGIREGGYWVVAGPTKGGKSALVRFIVHSLAIKQSKRTLLFGLEMSNEDTVEALMATAGRISASRMRDGKMTAADYTSITATSQVVSTAPLMFRDDVYDLAGIRSYVRQVKATFPDLAVVVVDYLQLTEGAGDVDRREQQIAAVSKALRRMAKDEGIAVIALAQLNDDGELRECRAIGMDATVQITIELTDTPGARRLRLRQRQGKTGIHVPVAFLGDTFEWHALAENEVPEEAPKKKGKWSK